MSSSVRLENLWAKFKDSPTESLVNDLSRLIDEIVADFNEHVDYSCLYGPICEMLEDNTINSHLVSHGLSLIDKIVADTEKRQDLVEDLLPAISYQTLYRYKQQPSDSLIKHCLETLKSASHDATIKHISNHTNQLLHLLVKLILRKDSPLLDISLAVLANLCRNNLIVQANIKCMDCIRSLYSRLMVLLGHDTMGIIVHALSLFTALCLNEDLGSKLFVGNVSETYELVINMLKTGDIDTQLYSLNLLIDFTKSQTMPSAFIRYKQLDDFMEYLINVHLPDSTGVILEKVCDFLHCLATNEELFKTIVVTMTTDENMSVTRYLLDNLHSNPVLSLLYVLLPDVCDNSEECREWTVNQLLKNVENIPLHTRRRRCYTTVVLSCQCLTVLYQDSLYKPLITSHLTSLPSQITAWLDSTPDPYNVSNQTKFSTEACRAVISVVSLCIDTQHPEFRLVLGHPHIASFIGKALLSQDTLLINPALKISALCVENSADYSATVSNILSHQSYLLQHSTEVLRQELGQLQQKCKDLQRQSYPDTSDRSPSPSVVHSTQISELIEHMRDGLHVQDLKASQLLEIFQEKIAIMMTKEEHLNDLVDAKTMALQQSDRLFTQFKNRVAQAEKECGKYRSLLQESERETELRQDDMCLLLKEKNDLIAELESVMAELVEASRHQDQYKCTVEELGSIKEKYAVTSTINSELNEKLEGLREEVEMLRVHNDTLKSQHDCDINQVQVLQKEKQKVVTKLEEKDNLYLKTKQTLRQAEEKCRRKDKEKIELESQLTKTRNELCKIEGRLSEVEERVKCLGCKLTEKEKQVESQLTELKEKKEEIEKYSKLMAMFHNLSGGKSL